MVEGDAVDPRFDEPGREQRPDLGGERDAPAVGPPVQRLHAEGVAGGDEPAPALVPEREGEDAAQVANAVEAVLLVRCTTTSLSEWVAKR